MDRLPAGLVTANRQPHDLEQLVRRVVADQQLTDRHLELELELVVAEVDPSKLERVVANLVANASRHTPPGGTIRVGLHQRSAATVLVVEDSTEPGSTRLTSSTSSNPSCRAPTSSTLPNPETGLGLTLAGELVMLHHGTLTASNRPDGGARFEVHLPNPETLNTP